MTTLIPTTVRSLFQSGIITSSTDESLTLHEKPLAFHDILNVLNFTGIQTSTALVKVCHYKSQERVMGENQFYED